MGTRFMIALSAATVGAMTIASLWAWPQAPEISIIAVHWNLAGEPVAHRSKEIVLSALPALALALSLGLAFATTKVTERTAKRFRGLWLAALAALAVVHVFFVLAAAGVVTSFGNYTALGPAVFLGVVGNYLAKDGTHRWPGRLLVLTALATFAAWIAVPGAAAEIVFIVGALAAAAAFAVAPRTA